MTFRKWMTCLSVLMLAGGLMGCSEQEGKEHKTRQLRGVADTIDLENNYVSMRVTNDKGVETLIEGTVREDTVVLINGRSQKVADIKPGDNVLVTGYREKKGDNDILIATRVEVTRPSDWKKTEQAESSEVTAEVTSTGSAGDVPTPSGKADAQDAAASDAAKASRDNRQRPQTLSEYVEEHGEELADSTPEQTVDEPTSLAPIGGDEEDDLRTRTEHMIYAMIRVKMEEALLKRADLLERGREPYDPAVRQLEGSIMKARDLLIEAGELVEDIEPPIVQVAPR